MIIDSNMLDYLGKLAKIKLSDSEREKTQRDLQTVLQFMNKLNELDTDSVETFKNCVVDCDCLREDTVFQSADTSDILANSENKKNNCFTVPKTVDGGLI